MKKRDTPAYARAKARWEQSNHDPDTIYNAGGLKHGWRGTPTYETWMNLRRRAQRGDVLLAHAWTDFDVFLADMGERPDGYVLRRIVGAAERGPATCLWRPRDERQPGVPYWEFDPLARPHAKDKSYHDWVKRAEAT